MNCTILYSFNYSLGILNESSIKVSKENIFAITTPNGICLMKIDDNWKEKSHYCPFYKYVINNPKETYLNKVNNFIKSNLNQFSINDLQRLYVDHTVFPFNNTSTYKGYRCLEWSNGENVKSIFALLSMEHELTIYESKGKSWYCVFNVSDLLIKNYLDNVELSLNYEYLRSLIYNVSVVKMCWTEFKKDALSQTNVCYLITTTKKGNLHIFKINQDKEELKCIYVNEWTSVNGKIKETKYYDDFLFLIFTNGTIEVCKLEIDYSKSNSFKINEQNKTVIWNVPDEIEVDNLIIYELSDKYYIIFTKNNFIIVVIMSKIIEYENMNKFKIDSTIVEYGIFTMSSTGICKLYNNKLLISSMDGTFVIVKINSDFTLKQEFLENQNLILPNFCCKGLNATKDGLLCCSINTICIYHDHLELRDSTQLNVFTLIQKDKVLSILDNIIESNQDGFLIQHHNLLECYKFFIRNDKFEFNLLNKYLEQDISNYNSLSLKILRYSILCELAYSNNEQLNEKYYKHLEQIEIYLTNVHIEDIFNKKLTKLDELQQESKIIMNKYIKKDCISDEQCPICNEMIKIDNHKIGTCLNRHSFSRCSNSLLLCDLTRYMYKICNLCKKSTFIFPVIWPSSESFCIYCS